MSVITFWNNSAGGHIGQTSSILATATLMAVEHNYKILIISTKLADKDTERAYGVVENTAMKFLKIKEAKFNSGIEGVMKLASSGKLTPELIGNYTKIVLKNRLEVLPGKNETEDEEIDKFDFNDYADVIKIADKYYDMVFIDLELDLNLEYVKRILKISDIIVCNMEQKIAKIEELLQFQKQERLVGGKNILYLINRYEKNSKYNVKNILRNSSIKDKIFTVPYDIMFSDIMQDGTCQDWFLNPKVRRATFEDEHGFFITEVNKFCDGIIYKIQELHMAGYKTK